MVLMRKLPAGGALADLRRYAVALGAPFPQSGARALSA